MDPNQPKPPETEKSRPNPTQANPWINLTHRQLWTSCCSTDSERTHRCCHLLNKVENIDRMPDIFYAFQCAQRCPKIAPSPYGKPGPHLTWFIGPIRVHSPNVRRSAKKRMCSEVSVNILGIHVVSPEEEKEGNKISTLYENDKDDDIKINT